jgi:hypothetical protein
MHKRLLLGITLLLVFGIALHAQSNRDYAILDITYEVSADQAQLILHVTVQNLGAAATTPSEIVTRIAGDPNRELSRGVVEPLAAGATQIIPVVLSANDFPVDGTQSIEVSVGLDAYELPNTPIAENNIRSIDITIATVAAENITLFDFNGEEFIVFGYVFSRSDAALYLAGFTVVVIVLWLISVVLRLIFRRPPRFGTWQPPYGMMPMYDQNTVEGRRQAWQTHAQNSLLLAAPTDGNLHPVKMLIGTDGGNLRNWKISAMRLSQYDTYGRIARSQAVADKQWVKRFNNLLKKRYGQSEAKVQKMLRPIARGLVQQFRKHVNKKNGFLPIALDIRMEGKHGEVRIVFELYQCQGRAWYRLDQWEPTMMIVAQTMQENFTFTIHGRMTHEKMNEFYDRLRDDLSWLLLEMVRVDEMASQPQQQQQPREAFNVPDTLSGMQPIHDDSQPYPSNA